MAKSKEFYFVSVLSYLNGVAYIYCSFCICVMAKSKEFYFVSVLSYLNGVPVGETVMLCLTRLFCVQYV